MRRTIVIAAVWLAAVAAGAIVGIATLGALGGTDPGNAPLSPQDVEDALARGTATPPSVAPPPSGAPSAGPRSYFSNPGGTVWASCAGGLATLSSVTPKQGFRIDHSQLGPATSAGATFKVDVRRGHAAEYTVTVTCVGDVPQAQQSGED